MKCASAVFLFAILATGVRADTVMLKNGDRVTGTIEHSDQKQLTLKTDFAGEINIKMSAVKGVVSASPVVVTTKENKTVTGKLNMEGTELTIAPPSAAPVQVPLDNVSIVRSESEQAAYEHSLHPGFIENWNGAVSFGFALARGNSNTTNLSTGFNAVRTTLNDKITAYAASIYASNDSPGQGVTANDIRGGIRYDRNFDKQWFAFGSADYEYNQLQELNLRQIYSGGLGYHAIKQPNITLDLLAGGNYTRESYSATAISPPLVRNLGGLTGGEVFMRKFGPSTTLNEQFFYYPDLTELGQYRMALDIGLVTKMNSWLAWQTTASDRLVSNPIPGTRKNDLILTTGLNVSFKD